ncbi:hypothetical protein [Candidatus Thiosymbion oneisti]|uniref:hypothetical protein n=1 Tax=Candidatus Thiosymbion oneisti TaxID=589554 RepID=UPI00105DF7A8|nr:hypothetical protein [Candidatus Thiosymbion oneisti]
MDTYLKYCERLALPILAVLFAITAFFAIQLEQLTADSNPYLLAEDHPARKGILDLQQEFSGTHDAVLIALYNPRGVFNETTLAAIYELTRRAKRIKLVDEATDGAQLRAIAAAHPRLREPLEAILANGLEQNDYFAATALSTGDELTALSYAERIFLRYLPYRLNPIKEMAGMAATENVFTDADGTLVVRKSLHDSTSAGNPAAIRNQIMGNEIMVNGVVSTDERNWR